jgi:hypothetical protein
MVRFACGVAQQFRDWLHELKGIGSLFDDRPVEAPERLVAPVVSARSQK